MKHSKYSAGKLATTVMAAALIAAAALGGVASASDEPVGTMHFLECISSAGCATTPSSSLNQATGLEIATDQSRVFVTASADDTVTILDRSGRNGKLSQDNLTDAKRCVNQGGTSGCGTGRALEDPADVTDDDKSIYVASPTDSAVSFIHQGNDKRWKQPGDLTGCFSEDGSTGGTCTNGIGLTGATSLALTPHTKGYLYVGGTNTLAWFERNKKDGTMTQGGCVNDDGSDTCVNNPFPMQGTITDLILSDDHLFLYATVSGTPGALLLFSVASGTPTPMGCFNDDGSGGCTDVPQAFVDPQSVTGFGKGQSLYVIAGGSDNLEWFQRDAQLGTLTPAGCFNTGGTGGCFAAPGLTNMNRVKLCENAGCLILSAGDGIAVFQRNTKTGVLSQPGLPFIPCFNKTGTGGCTQADGLGGAGAIDSISGGKKQVYVAGSTDDAVSEFRLK